MTKESTNPTDTKAPKYYAYHVVQPTGRSQKSRWNRIGAAFAHNNGDGVTVILDSLPIAFNGEIILLPPKAE